MASALFHYQAAERLLGDADEILDTSKHGHIDPDDVDDAATFVASLLWSAQVHAQLAQADAQAGMTLGVQS